MIEKIPVFSRNEQFDGMLYYEALKTILMSRVAKIQYFSTIPLIIASTANLAFCKANYWSK